MNFSSKQSKENTAAIALIYQALGQLEKDLKTIEGAAAELNTKIAGLERFYAEYAEELEENIKAERRFTDGVTNLLNYDFSVASKPLNGRAEK